MKITENTLIPISLVIVILAAGSWLTSVYAEVQTNSRDIKETRDVVVFELKRTNDRLEKINERLDAFIDKRK